MQFKYRGEFDGEPGDILAADGSITGGLRFELKKRWDIAPDGTHLDDRTRLTLDLINPEWKDGELKSGFELRGKDGYHIASGWLSGPDQPDQNGWYTLTGNTHNGDDLVKFVYALPECHCDEGEFFLEFW